MRDASYRESLAVIKAAAGEEAEPFTHFLKLETPVFAPAAADTALTFEAEAACERCESRQARLELDRSGEP